MNTSKYYLRIEGLWYHFEILREATQTEDGLVRKRQCDRKTIRRIEAGEFGPLAVIAAERTGSSARKAG